MQYDMAIISGGLAGASLAMALAGHGARVVIVEHQPVFRDRIHGEVTHPWGVAETIALGIYQSLLDSCGHETRWVAAQPRDLIATTPWEVGCLNFYHPDMQQKLLDLAVQAGAELRRPAEVVGVEVGPRPALLVRSQSGTERPAIGCPR